VAAFNVTAHVVLPLQPPPLHPVKLNVLLGVAVKVICVPLAKLAEQVAGQLMPLGVLVTVPVPAPDVVTVRVEDGTALKVAVIDVAAVRVTAQVPVPLQPPPLHPVNANPFPAVAVSVTCVLFAKVPVHVGPQLIPDGLLVTVPVPDKTTVNCQFFGGGGGVPPLELPPPQPVQKIRPIKEKQEKAKKRTLTPQSTRPEYIHTPTIALWMSVSGSWLAVLFAKLPIWSGVCVVHINGVLINLE
jgi:hypothetical protein